MAEEEGDGVGVRDGGCSAGGVVDTEAEEGWGGGGGGGGHGEDLVGLREVERGVRL